MSEISFERRGGLAVASLNRPKALNALTLEMCLDFDRMLAEWETDPSIKAVFVKGEGERAFCAGGDVLAIHSAGKSGGALVQDFFLAEYRLNRRVHHFSKPFVALIDGIVMGGGCGISQHGSHRVATERTLFAMPETGIGLFPDVGGTWFLNECPGKVGLYLGTTGARLKAADMLAVGLATNRIASTQGGELEDRLAALDWEAGAPETLIDTVLDTMAAPTEPAPLKEHLETINNCFEPNTVGAIIGRLERHPSSFAAETLAALKAKAPMSVGLAFRQLEDGRGLDFDDMMVREYRLVQACLAAPDFYEGIRALLIDKDKQPKWTPATLGEVEPDAVSRYFDEPPTGDLTF